MTLKSVLILCAVLVFCDAKSLIGRTTYYGLDDGSNHPVFGHPNDPPLEATTEDQDNKKEYSFIDNSNKKQFFISTEMLSWQDAKDACEKMGMKLVTTKTYDEIMDFEGYVIRNLMVPKDQYSGYWIGSRRRSSTDPWIWTTDGEEFSSQFGWLPGEPSNFEGEDCIEFKYDLYTIGWNNYYCNDLRRFACESSAYGTNELWKNALRDSKETLHAEFLKESAQTDEKIETSSREEGQDLEDKAFAISTEPPFKYVLNRNDIKNPLIFEAEPERCDDYDTDDMGTQYADSDYYDQTPFRVTSVGINEDESLNQDQDLSTLDNDDVQEILTQTVDIKNQAQLDNRNNSTHITRTDNQEHLQHSDSTEMHNMEHSYMAKLEPSQEPASTAATANDDLDSTSEEINNMIINYDGVLRIKDGSEEFTLSPLEIESLKTWWTSTEDEDVEDYPNYYSK